MPGLIDLETAFAFYWTEEGTSPFYFPSFPCTILPRHPNHRQKVPVPDDPTPPTVAPYLRHPDVIEILVASAWAYLATLADLHLHWTAAGNLLPLQPPVASVASIGEQLSRRKRHASVQFRASSAKSWTEILSIGRPTKDRPSLADRVVRPT